MVAKKQQTHRETLTIRILAKDRELIDRAAEASSKVALEDVGPLKELVGTHILSCEPGLTLKVGDVWGTS